MRLLRSVAFVVVFASIGFASLESHGLASMQAPPRLEAIRSLLHSAAVKCGMFDGHFACRSTNEIVTPGGKNVIPGTTRQLSTTPAPAPVDPGNALPAAPPASPPTTPTGCPAGMAGAPPNCQCPRGTEQLGGHCIAYTESCATGLAANANPQACPSAEEKQVCTVRADGLKDCCCRTYSKF